MSKKNDITEVGVDAIEYQVSPTELRVHQPHDGVAKWFRDELKQLWCKFTTAESGAFTQHVIKAHTIIEVRYDKTPTT